MNGKHMQLSIQNPFYNLHSVQEAILILRYFILYLFFGFMNHFTCMSGYMCSVESFIDVYIFIAWE